MFKKLFKKRSNYVKLNDEQKILIEEQLEEGKKPSEISDMLDIELTGVYQHYHTCRRRKERAKPTSELQELRDQLKIEDLRHEIEAKRQKKALELEKLKLDIEMKKAELYGDDEEDEISDNERIMMNIIQSFIGKKDATKENSEYSNGFAVQSVLPPSESQTNLNNQSDELNIDQIKDIVHKIPKTYLKIAKKMDDETLKTMIRNKYPVPENTLNQAVEVIRNV